MSATKRSDRHVSDDGRGGRLGGARSFEQYQFKTSQPSEYICHTWFERDRANIRLETPRGRVVFDLWDDEVTQAIKDGFLTVPRVPRPRDDDWQHHAVLYAAAMGLVALP